MLVRNWSEAARYGLPGLILGVGLAWVGGARGPEAVAQSGLGAEPRRVVDPYRGAASGGVASDEAGGTLAFVASPAGGGQGQLLYLIDTKARAFAVYRVDPNNPKGVVKLEAARQYQYDLRIEHYNNLSPEPSAIKEMLNAAPQPGRPSRDR